MRSGDVHSVDSDFVWHIWHNASVMAADSFEASLEFFQQKDSILLTKFD